MQCLLVTVTELVFVNIKLTSTTTNLVTLSEAISFPTFGLGFTKKVIDVSYFYEVFCLGLKFEKEEIKKKHFSYKHNNDYYGETYN